MWSLKGCTCGQARVSSVSGGITYTGRLEKQGRYEFKSHSGDITAGDAATATTSKPRPSAASVKPEVGVTMRSGEDDGGRMGTSVKGAVGGGGAYVEVRTFSGSIYLTKGQ